MLRKFVNRIKLITFTFSDLVDVNEMEAEVCVICKKPFDDDRPVSTLHSKESDRINKASKERGNDLQAAPGQRIHQECWRVYTNAHSIACDLRCTDAQESQQRICTLRSDSPKFEASKHCIFCGQSAKYAGKKRGFDDIQVRTKVFRNSFQTVREMQG